MKKMEKIDNKGEIIIFSNFDTELKQKSDQYIIDIRKGNRSRFDEV